MARNTVLVATERLAASENSKKMLEISKGRPKRRLVFGHSHVISFELAAREPDSIIHQQDDIEYGLMRMEPGEAVTDGDILNRIAAFVEAAPEVPTVLAALLGGNEYNFIGMVAHNPPFDFYSPTRPELGPVSGADVIPYRLVEARLAAQRVSSAPGR